MAEASHVLLVPFATEGHINGLLGFAQVLASHGLLITFAYPARAHALIKQRGIAPQNHPSVKLHIVPDGLPTDQKEIPTLPQVDASIPIVQDALKLLIQNLSSGALPISCIISDSFVPWTQDLANDVALPRIEFFTSTATVYSMGVHLPELIARGHLPVKKHLWTLEAPPVDFIPGLPPFHITELPYEFLTENLSDNMFQFMVRAYSRAREAQMVLVNSTYELESNAYDGLQSAGISAYSVGPLFQPPVVRNKGVSNNNARAPLHDSECLRWLDQQAESSVVYVALGSVAKLSTEETHEMALGLEALGYPFLWVVRADTVNEELEGHLPKGFLSRTAESGLIISWAPQPEVLKHASVGVFLSHCGWNSTMESIWGGKAMVACPRAAEQRSNARQIVDKWKVGVELKREKDGSFKKEAVEEAVKGVMLNGEYRQRALDMKKVSHESIEQGGSSFKNTVDLVRNMKRRFLKQE